MKKIIVFLYLTNNKKAKKYLSYFKEQLKDFDLKTFEELKKDELERCKVAIVLDSTKEQLQSFPNLIWVQSVKAGVEKLIEQLNGSQVQISRLIDNQLSYTMANTVLAWVYCIQKNIYAYKIQQNNSIWNEIEEQENEDTNIAILGLGELGLKSANKLLENDFKISAWARSKKDVKNIKMYYGDDGLDEILTHADIVVCLLPLSKSTRNIISKDKINLMKKGSAFINFARGAIVDYEAIELSINNGQIKHAVLDVFNTEPLDKNSTLWANEKISILPHVSAITNLKTASKISSDNVNKYYNEGKFPSFINKELGY
ncbi:MAG: glyoxylate/hydroxypyruvate reductase A [Campylobacteraceae bacterium]|nr:glyoxylate/hydroxypyruvate reductase A [Campylobacteraceae bacterium]